jgi:hypothetical protein
MANIMLVKLPDGKLTGLSDTDKIAYTNFKTRLNNLEVGELCTIDAKLPRNSKFHRKFMALIQYAFDAWEPQRNHKTYKGIAVSKNFDSFRHEITILAGFYEQTFDLHGNMKLIEKSIAFSKMEQPEFELVYDAVATVILEKVLITYKGREELDLVMNKVLGFL